MKTLPPLLADGRGQQVRALVALGVVQAVLAACIALGVRTVFDGMQSPSPIGEPLALAVAVAVVAVVIAAAQVGVWLAVGHRAAALGQDYVASVRSALLEHCFRLSPQSLHRLRHGHLMARLTGDLAALDRWIGRCLAPLMVGAAMLLCAAMVLAWLAPVLATLAVLAVAASATLGWLASRRLEVALRAERRQRWALAGQLGERLAQPVVVQTAGQARHELSRLAGRHRRLAHAATRRAVWSALLRALPVATATLVLGATVAWGVGHQDAGQGSMASLAGLLVFVGLLLSPLRDLARALIGWRAWRVSREKLASFLARAPMADGGGDLTLAAPHGHLAIDRLSLSGALHEVSLDLPPATTLAVHGPSGAGKSALLAACAGLVDTAMSQVRIDGQPLAGCSRASIAARVALVSPALPPLRGNLVSNLRYRRPGADPERIRAALVRAGLGRWLDAVPGGLEARVGEAGRNLPGVVRHRLGLARALVGEPSVILVDDFDAMLTGEPDEDEPLARWLAEPGATVVIVTRQRDWQRRCGQALRLVCGRSTVADRPAPVLSLAGSLRSRAPG